MILFKIQYDFCVVTRFKIKDIQATNAEVKNRQGKFKLEFRVLKKRGKAKLFTKHSTEVFQVHDLLDINYDHEI